MLSEFTEIVVAAEILQEFRQILLHVDIERWILHQFLHQLIVAVIAVI